MTVNPDALRQDLLNLAFQGAEVTVKPQALASLRARIWPKVREHFDPSASRNERSIASPRPPTDPELAQLLAAGDPSAFDVLFDRYAGKLLGYARRSLSLPDAEDAVQEAFLTVSKRVRELPAHSNLAGFLFRTVRDRVVEAIRRRHRFDLEPLDEAQLSDEENALAELCRDDERTRLAVALNAACNPLEQDVVLLFAQGYSNVEIARHLQLKPGHVGVLKHRALQKLREELEINP